MGIDVAVAGKGVADGGTTVEEGKLVSEAEGVAGRDVAGKEVADGGPTVGCGVGSFAHPNKTKAKR